MATDAPRVAADARAERRIASVGARRNLARARSRSDVADPGSERRARARAPGGQAADHVLALAWPSPAAAVSSSWRGSHGADQRARRRGDHRPHRRAPRVSHGARLDVAQRGARAPRGWRASSSEGGDLAITPDGPRGPAHDLAPGVAIVAQPHRRAGDRGAHPRPSAWRRQSGIVSRFRAVRRITIAYSDPLYVTAADAREAAEAVDRVAETMAAAERAAHG